MLYIASDHGGFGLKESIKEFLHSQGIEFSDLGPARLDPGDDYPDFAAPVARKISSDPESMGILICRSGQGVAIVANKFRGVRAALVWNSKEAAASRRDDLSNVLCLPSDYITEAEGREIAEVWLHTPAGTENRHLRRVSKIEKLEQELYKQ